MQTLAAQLGETVDCAVLVGHQGRDIHVLPATRHTLRAVAEVGQEFPLHATASGKALLAARDPGDALRMLPGQLTSYTTSTPVTLDRVLADLDRARATGVAHDREETALGDHWHRASRGGGFTPAVTPSRAAGMRPSRGSTTSPRRRRSTPAWRSSMWPRPSAGGPAGRRHRAAGMAFLSAIVTGTSSPLRGFGAAALPKGSCCPRR
jgi:Bacterial transcriptional regulator